MALSCLRIRVQQKDVRRRTCGISMLNAEVISLPEAAIDRCEDEGDPGYRVELLQRPRDLRQISGGVVDDDRPHVESRCRTLSRQGSEGFNGQF